MIINDLGVGEQFRLTRILQLLENAHGLTIDFKRAKSSQDLVQLYNQFEQVKRNVLESNTTAYHNDRDYAKACLVQEAVVVFLAKLDSERNFTKSKR